MSKIPKQPPGNELSHVLRSDYIFVVNHEVVQVSLLMLGDRQYFMNGDLI